MGYRQVHDRSLSDPEDFWSEAADAIDWERRWNNVLQSGEGPFDRWFAGGMLNTCHNALDRHVDGGRGEQIALIHDSPVTDTIERLSYRELRDRVALLAGVLRAHGVNKGDRVIVYMPMVPAAAMAMLACARIGAVHSVVFGGFSSAELAKRIDDAQPTMIVSASCGIEPGRIVEYKPLLDRAIELAAHKPRATLILARPQATATLVEGRDFDWHAEMTAAEPAECVPVEATDPLYILYTSGTTGRPKGIVRDNGGHAVALAWSMPNVYDVAPGEVFWAASDVGWVVGHSYIVYAPLLIGATTLLFEGKPVGTPDAGTFWRVIEQHKVCTLFTAPTAFRAIRKEDPRGELMDRHDLSGLRALFLAGERCDPNTLEWAQRHLKVPVIDHWWQTETGWPVAADCLGIEALPVKAGSPTCAVPGYDVRVLDDNGHELPDGEIGAIVIKLPMPPGCLATLWRADRRCRDAYLRRFPGYYLTGDAGIRDSDGYLWIMSRIDDVINVAGHRLSTGEMEEALAAHPMVAECAVFGVRDELKGELPLGLVVLKSGSGIDEDQLRAELIQQVRDSIGPVAAFKLVAVVERLPKTRSGKILRGTMRNIADGKSWTPPATIDDPVILDEIEQALTKLGYPGR
ncbi:MAG: propionyl-CoA synthetase [Xanthomonadales bacterium]|nr:propionyl-CoA synthetase [Xanthomonadales bacterium]